MTGYTEDDGVTERSAACTFEGYNRRTETVTENGVTAASRTYDYDDIDRLVSVTDDADPVNPVTVNYTYDANGNTLRKADSSKPGEDLVFAYDARDKLVQTYKGTASTLPGQYDNNYSGLRVRHRFSDRGSVDYFYDGNSVIREENADTGRTLAEYRYGDRLISLTTPGKTQYYHHDALGSTVNLTDVIGSTEAEYVLDPWGKITAQTGGSVNRQIFTGQEHDENTGLIYFGARYYDPDTARFITQDSYLGEAGVPPSLHRYLYAYSNPTVYVDLLGYISSREAMGLDERSVFDALGRNNSLGTIGWLTAKQSFYDLWNGVTGGFVGRQDDRQEKYDRGQISASSYWLGTGIDTGISVGSQFLGGAVAGKAGGGLAGVTGSKFTGAVLGEGLVGGAESLIQQSGEVLSYHSSGGQLGQSKISYSQAFLSAGISMVMSSGMYGAQKFFDLCGC